MQTWLGVILIHDCYSGKRIEITTFSKNAVAPNIKPDCSEASFLSDFENECNSCNYVVHFNINSLLSPGKLDQLKDYCKILKVDVLIITESKLDQTIPTNLITIPGYHEQMRQDREVNGRFGGGVLMYIAENLVFEHKQNLQNSNFEHIWADVKINGIIYSVNAS